MKRFEIKKLPPVLAIHLKCFDYDYFEFPCELDKEPYTVAGVAKMESSEVSSETEVIHQKAPLMIELVGSSHYRLVVLVHSGQW